MFGLPAPRARPQPCTGPAGEDRRVHRHGPSWSDLAPRASMRVLGIRVGVRPARPGPSAGKNALVRRLRPQPDSRSNWRRTVSKEARSEEHTSELQSPYDLVCRLLLEKKKNDNTISRHSTSTLCSQTSYNIINSPVL